MRTHKRLIDVLEPTSKTVDALMRLNASRGVDIENQAVMSIGLLGRKLGMTRSSTKTGRGPGLGPARSTPSTVTQLRTAERDGYTAVQLGFGEARRLTKPDGPAQGPAAVTATLREFRLDEPRRRRLRVGQQLAVADMFARW